MTFNAQTTTEDWIRFLKVLTDTAEGFEQKLIICPKLTMFQSSQSKKFFMQIAKPKAAILLLKGTITEEERDVLIEDWTKGLTISGFLPMIRNCGILAVFKNPLGNAIEQQSGDVISWHTYAIFYKDRVLGVYDPSFNPQTEMFHSCTGVPLVKGLVKAFRGKGTTRKISEIWFGGGGGDGETDSQEMTRRWIEEEIVVQRGANLGNWDQREGWVKVRF
ncbi:hypothetical protein HOY82DRAFT_541894 [Tuber indicum]|nr:hypothetical protein HOY82DRAFT_541894 [Tuber indicum]